MKKRSAQPGRFFTSNCVWINENDGQTSFYAAADTKGVKIWQNGFVTIRADFTKMGNIRHKARCWPGSSTTGYCEEEEIRKYL